MDKNIKTGIIFAIIGGIVTFLFGGWSVAVIGVALGVSMGLSFGNGLKRKDPVKIGLAVLPSALVAAAVLLAFSLFQNFSIMEAIGKRPAASAIVFPFAIPRHAVPAQSERRPHRLLGTTSRLLPSAAAFRSGSPVRPVRRKAL